MDPTFYCSPLYNTHVKFVIGDILKLNPVPGSKVLFMRKGHLINKVELFAIVTSMQLKEGSVFCSLDDGTGTISCFCDLPKSLNSATENVPHRKPDVGNFVNVLGVIKQGLWNNCIYISSSSWSIIKNDRADVQWLEHINEQKKLYAEVYDKEFINIHLKDLLKSMSINDAKKLILNKLEPVINSIITESKFLPSHFFGYEILELQEVQNINSELLLKNTENNFTKSQILKVSIQGIASILHNFVINGELIKKKCLKHEVLSNNDQLDAHYFVTRKTQSVILGVKNALNKIGQTSNDSNHSSVLRAFNVPEFNFIRSSKHGIIIIEKALNEISNINRKNH